MFLCFIFGNNIFFLTFGWFPRFQQYDHYSDVTPLDSVRHWHSEVSDLVSQEPGSATAVNVLILLQCLLCKQELSLTWQPFNKETVLPSSNNISIGLFQVSPSMCFSCGSFLEVPRHWLLI